MSRLRRPLVLLTIALLVGGFAGVRALRTTPTAISASDAARVVGAVDAPGLIAPRNLSLTITAVECDDDVHPDAVVERRQGVEFCDVAPGSVAVEMATRTVGGSERPVVVVTTEVVVGDGAEPIELLLDVDTGLPFHGIGGRHLPDTSPLGDAGYAEGYGWTETSLESIG